MGTSWDRMGGCMGGGSCGLVEEGGIGYVGCFEHLKHLEQLQQHELFVQVEPVESGWTFWTCHSQMKPSAAEAGGPGGAQPPQLSSPPPAACTISKVNRIVTSVTSCAHQVQGLAHDSHCVQPELCWDLVLHAV